MLLPEIRDEILSRSPSELYRNMTIPEALDSVYRYASDKPHQVTVSPNAHITQTLSGLRGYDFLTGLLRDTENWLKLFYFGMLYRVVAYVDDIVAGFNQRALLRVPVATRALLELFFVLFSTYRQVNGLRQDTMSLPFHDHQKAIKNELGIRELLLRQFRATRINWDNPFGDDWEQVSAEVRQTNILSMLEKLPQGTREIAERWYGILSDICHPNFGSVLYVLDHDSIREQPPTLVLARSLSTRAHLEMTVDLVSAPLAFACLQHVAFLSVLDQLLAHYREGIERFSK